jgi:hypothetical protein
MPVPGLQRRFKLASLSDGGELFGERFDEQAGFGGAQQVVQFGSGGEEAAVTRLPFFERGAGVDTAGDIAVTLVEAVFQGLRDQIFFEALLTGFFEDSEQPDQLAVVQVGEGIADGSSHEVNA